MLLERLAVYGRSSRDDVASFHRDREFRWKLDIRTRNGAVDGVALAPLRDLDAPKRGVTHTVPTSDRTMNVLAHLAADDVQYVLGWGDDTTKDSRVADCHRAYVGLIDRWAAAVDAVADPVPHLLSALYGSGRLTELVRPEGIRAKDGVVTIVDGVPAYRSRSAAEYWSVEVVASKSTGRVDACLVCGRFRELTKNIPMKVPASLVPGASNDAALVSVNARVFGYDLTDDQLTYTPICLHCANDMMGGLIGVLSSEHTMTYPAQDTRMAWWVSDPDEQAPAEQVIRPDPDRINTLLRSVHHGKPTANRKAARFCWLAVGGNVSRVMVRDWIDMALASDDPETPSLDRNIAAWFDDHRNTPRWSQPRTLTDGTMLPPGRHWHGVEDMVKCLGRWDQRAGQYARPGAKNADRFAQANHELLRSAFLGVPVSMALRAHLLHRISNDGRVDDIRAALIRLALNRCPHRIEDSPMPTGLDKNLRAPAYLAGRLFALLEQTQRTAHRDLASRTDETGTRTDGSEAEKKTEKKTDEVNSTFTSRYFRSAVATPRVALTQGRIEADAWLSKISRRQSPRLAAHCKKQLTELYELVEGSNGLPMRCSLRQQEQFILGYHHQLADSANSTSRS
ncbi:type I-C CRISPR-associated protein Cas8c/Csd1 [Nocardia sp. NPDC051990]|uniref:type I-C CRISPR-associated protein Cas8c/Csd1 n=1 Tax=Nocardia sp. NPDC051990 TaxID=3155285 RepID=UPI00341A8A82